MATVSDVPVAFALGRLVPVRQHPMNGTVTPLRFMTLLRHIAVLALQLVLLAPATALQFQPNPSTGEILATGTVELDDADRITKLITLEYRQEHRLVRGFVTVNLDSPGGSLLGGLRLGYALRKLTVHTNVGQGQACFSACALAFLGGQQRTVEGHYGVHAASLQAKITASPAALQLDTVQHLSAITTAYAQEMTGRNDVALRALSTSASQISVLDDADLVTMGVITMARRPGQFGRVGFRCPPKQEHTVLGAICMNLDIAEMDLELNRLYANIRAEGSPAGLTDEQERWRRYRNSCVYDGVPNGYASVVHCVRVAYSVRRDQLLSIWLGISARKDSPATNNWQPHMPQQ